MKGLLIMCFLIGSSSIYAQKCKQIIDPFTKNKTIEMEADSMLTDKGKIYYQISKTKNKIIISLISGSGETLNEGKKVQILFTDDSKITLPDRQSGTNYSGVFLTFATIKNNKITDYDKEFEMLAIKKIKIIRFNRSSDYIVTGDNMFSDDLNCITETQFQD